MLDLYTPAGSGRVLTGAGWIGAAAWKAVWRGRGSSPVQSHEALMQKFELIYNPS